MLYLAIKSDTFTILYFVIISTKIRLKHHLLMFFFLQFKVVLLSIIMVASVSIDSTLKFLILVV